jgi:predicted  nucleic acid-binding Zn-ribbon protein
VDIDFERLIRLQSLDSEIRETTLVLESLPRLIQEVRGRIEAGSAAVAAAKDKLAENQKRRRDLETRVKDLKVQIGKYKRQLNEVKTNKEYTSLLKEIEDSQHEIDGLEEEIIAEMLAADDIEESIKTASMKQRKDEEDLRKEETALGEKGRQIEARLAELVREKEAVAPEIPPEQMRLYAALATKKGGAALSAVRGDFCALCHMRIRPQMLNEIRDKAALILCENCGRILYWPPKPDSGRPD